VTRLRELGADTVEVPLIAIAPPADGGAALRDALGDPARFDGVVITSPNGADALVEAAGGPASLRAARVAVVGNATAARLEQHGVAPALVPRRFVAEGLLEVFPDPPAGGGRVLLAQAAGARQTLSTGLRERGWTVDVVVAYRTVTATVDAAARAAVAGADVVTFASSSTVESFLDAFGADAVPPIVACIGPVTAETARARGLVVSVVAEPHTIDGLVASLATHVVSRAG
jgi:uroporphyrinogen-III synthase